MLCFVLPARETVCCPRQTLRISISIVKITKNKVQAAYFLFTDSVGAKILSRLPVELPVVAVQYLLHLLSHTLPVLSLLPLAMFLPSRLLKCSLRERCGPAGWRCTCPLAMSQNLIRMVVVSLLSRMFVAIGTKSDAAGPVVVARQSIFATATTKVPRLDSFKIYPLLIIFLLLLELMVSY